VIKTRKNFGENHYNAQLKASDVIKILYYHHYRTYTKDQLAEVERALEKFAKGTYGLCENCGKPINPERLEALPQALYCMECNANKAKNG